MNPLDPRVWLVLIFALASAFGVGYWRGGHAVQKLWNADTTKQQLADTEAALKVEKINRERERNLRHAAEQNTLVAESELAAARRAVVAADAAGQRLRQQVAQLVVSGKRQAGATPSADPGSQADPAGSAALDLLAELHARTDEAAGAIAAVADDARIRGLACERQHDSLVK